MRKAALEVTFSSALISKLNILMFRYEATISNVSTLDDINDFVFTKWGSKRNILHFYCTTQTLDRVFGFCRAVKVFFLKRAASPEKRKDMDID